MELRDKNGLTEQEFLQQYNPGRYPRPSVTVDNLIFSETNGERKLLLVKRGGHPCLGMWALPGGFVSPNETTEQASARELEEETHLKGIPARQLYTVSTPGRDKRTWTMSVCYLAVLQDILPVKADDDAAQAAWFSVDWKLLAADASPILQSDRYVLTLTYGDTVLTAEILHQSQQTGYGASETVELVKSDGIAFDHAMLIARGLLSRA
jgi:ADP-ribose pyrophosphatase YjhB (NUDIX family)